VTASREQRGKQQLGGEMMFAVTLLLPFLAGVHTASIDYSSNYDHENYDLWRIIRGEIVTDIKETREYLQDSINENKNDTIKLYHYIDASIDRLSTGIVKSVEELKSNTEERLSSLLDGLRDWIDQAAASVPFSSVGKPSPMERPALGTARKLGMPKSGKHLELQEILIPSTDIWDNLPCLNSQRRNG
jgi:hypothetical protein